MSYRVGIIGAARRHQGTGPFIARNFAQLGHKIAGIVGSNEASAQQASKQLLQDYDIHTHAYANFESLVSEQDINIVAISTPPSSHIEYLEQALQRHCHVFCEKPLWWPNESATSLNKDAYLRRIDSVVELAQKHHCYIHLNTQWPYTLKDFFKLHPDALSDKTVKQFTMNLSPQSQGETMLIDAASHGLSMLYQLVGNGRIEDIQINHNTHSASINFNYLHSEGCTKATLGFIQSNETPKPASYQINGFSVKRLVALPEYQIQLQSDQQTINIQDPLDASIKDFLAGVEAQMKTDETSLMQGGLHLYQLIEHYITS